MMPTLLFGNSNKGFNSLNFLTENSPGKDKRLSISEIKSEDLIQLVQTTEMFILCLLYTSDAADE